jgi:hypothetical protein
VGDRSFDVAISYFGDNVNRSFPEATYVHRFKGGKWDGLYAFFKAFPESQRVYDYFWFPDDDIVASAQDIGALISLGRTYGLDLFQPALDNHSYFSHLLTLRHPSFLLRYSNFVEIMVPVLSRPLLDKALPTMAETRSGFGLDFLWAEMANALSDGDNIRNVAIVDAVCVRHTRPVGGSLHQFMKKVGGRSATDELTNAVEKVGAPVQSQIAGVAVPRIRMLSGVDKTGTPVRGCGAVLSIILDLTFRYRNDVQAVPFMGVIKHALKAGFGA